MSAYVSKEELRVLPTNRISYPEHYAEASTRRSGLFSQLVGRLSAYLQRQATLAELSALSDRELADIGLTRSSLSTVFEPIASNGR